ncbi:Rrf2 family transcriptional regulator [Albimonas sp. CAU 1670]|uniref:RrF2 family transcriptional regulator n=1 Tax=Albimonas sp. CAU 1670 TaxID=3032599 RepID=UPI0023DA0378|nr:Rrf2 family transcriptional regulator [Albimonas sp. CAU 1670]MDF2231103.1 Rrf2 family transcriptional regulator [Albimonas sp. CAU 1670]
MLKLTRKTLLAIEAVADIAYNARPDPVQARDVTERQGIPQRYLEQVMQALVRAGVLKGVRGPRGGYTLARERRRITVGDVVRVVSTLDAEDGDAGPASDLGVAVVSPVWEEMQRDLLERLDRVTMEDLCREAQRLRVPRADETRPDFTI